MKAVAVSPGQPNSAHLREIPTPNVGDIPDGRGVLVKVLRVGPDGADREINAGPVALVTGREATCYLTVHRLQK